MIADGVCVDLAWKINVLSSTARIAVMEMKGLSIGTKDLVFHSKTYSTLLPFLSAEKSKIFFSVSRTVYGESARVNAGSAKSCDTGVARRGSAFLEDTEYTHGFRNPESSVRKTRVSESIHPGKPTLTSRWPHVSSFSSPHVILSPSATNVNMWILDRCHGMSG